MTDLDRVLFYDTANEHLSLYARFPVTSAFASDCDYGTEDVACNGGFIQHIDTGEYLLYDGHPKMCPVCSTKKLNGPGSYVEVEPPGADNDKADLRNPVQFAWVGRDVLDYNDQNVAARKDDIFCAVTGHQGSPINDQAVNEKQVRAMFESRESALKEIQKNFELIIEWSEKTKCLLEYGPESFQGMSVSLGTEHYIFSSAQILEMYRVAKENQFSIDTLNMLDDLYYETEYRNNPEMFYRHQIVANLDPFRHISDEAVTTMYQSGEINYTDYLVKKNLASFIMKFERENTKITRFGSALNFQTKIERIKESLTQYAADMKPEAQNQD